MNLQEFNNLAEDPASVSWPVKIIALAVMVAVILFMGYKFIIVDHMNNLTKSEAEEKELRQTFETRQRRASQLVDYQQQLEEMQRSFGNLMQQLPSGTEIPALILDISEKGVSNGLAIELFEPLNEVSQEFYAEKPIKLIARGSYRQLATFVSDISGLPRIVTIHNIELSPEEVKKNTDGENKTRYLLGEEEPARLRMEAIIKTYRYMEDEMDEVGQSKNSQLNQKQKNKA